MFTVTTPGSVERYSSTCPAGAGSSARPSAWISPPGTSTSVSNEPGKIARSVSTPPSLNISVIGCIAWSPARPSSNAAPARAATSPSPEASTTTFARSAWRPLLLSAITPATRPSAISGAETNV
jgi:hypothetical protein